MTYKLSLDGTELKTFKITFNVGDRESYESSRSGKTMDNLVYDQKIWDENHELVDNITRVMMFVKQDYKAIEINYYSDTNYMRNEIYPFHSILSTEAIIKDLDKI